jgi:hypothetical protein
VLFIMSSVVLYTSITSLHLFLSSNKALLSHVGIIAGSMAMTKTSAIGATKYTREFSRNIFSTIQNKFRLEQKGLLELYKNSKKSHKSDFITVESFNSYYKSLWIHLEKQELEFIYNIFGYGNEGKVNWKKFIQRLDILPPDDFAEPDNYLDALPWPICGIVDIIEVRLILIH